MDEITESSNKKNSIMLSRNTPVALVVGAAGFLGSHLTDRLLEKDIQVIGVDDLETGKRENLREAVEDKNFHLIIKSAEKLDLDLERLDYLFIAAEGNWDLSEIFEALKKFKCRCLYISTIELYSRENADIFKRNKEIESKLAKFATEFNLNVRVLRLGPVFGPRMHFRTKDPLIRLIQQALTSDLQKEIALEFSSRALYVSDAVDLMVRTIFAGSTAQKIFDGVLPTPIKVAEIKQILLDPVWHETRDFTPSLLPPWPTPNLEKTMKTLNWRPTHKLVTSLRKTISYFKENEIIVPEIKNEELEEKQEIGIDSVGEEWKKDKKEQLEGFKSENKPSEIKQIKNKQGSSSRKFLSKIYLSLVLALITYALIWPGIMLALGIFNFRQGLNEGYKNLGKGEFEQSLINIKGAKAGIEEVKSVYSSLEPIRKFGFLDKQFAKADKFLNLSILTTASAESTVLGIQQLLLSIRAITGETTNLPENNFQAAQTELSSASENLAKAEVLLSGNDVNFDFFQKLSTYNNLVKQALAISVLLPKLTAVEGSASYLILLQNNMELRPGGGFIGSFAKASFEGGKLKKLDVNDIYAIDGQLNTHVEPPKEIKEDLGQKDWFLRDSNWEPDFPINARQAEWFYTKETGERVDGVIALDVSAIEGLLSGIGTLDLPDYGEKITAENLFEKAITHAETGFFPGSQAKKSFLTALANQAFNKIFFLPQNNWPAILTSLNRSFAEKHLSIYLNDPKLFSYLDAEGWVHAMPRQQAANARQDFLSLIEANLGANKVNYYLDRNYKLETAINKDGEVKHKLRINYTNRSPFDAFPGGQYKNRMRIYLPAGSKLTKASWGEGEITKDVTSFVDYGRAGYSFVLKLDPKEQKTLVLDYTVPIKLEFDNGKTSYRLDIIKQAGTGKDPLEWTLTYPISYQLVSENAQAISPQEQTISTDLSVNRSFEVEFQK